MYIWNIHFHEYSSDSHCQYLNPKVFRYGNPNQCLWKQRGTYPDNNLIQLSMSNVSSVQLLRSVYYNVYEVIFPVHTTAHAAADLVTLQVYKETILTLKKSIFSSESGYIIITSNLLLLHSNNISLHPLITVCKSLILLQQQNIGNINITSATKP